MPKSSQKPEGKAAHANGGLYPSRRLIGVLVAAIGILLATFFALRDLRVLGSSGQWVTHTEQVRFELQQLWGHLLEIESGPRGYALGGSDRFLASYNAAVAVIGSELSALERLTAGNPVQQTLIQRLQSQVTRHREAADQAIESVRRGDSQATRAAVNAGIDASTHVG